MIISSWNGFGLATLVPLQACSFFIGTLAIFYFQKHDLYYLSDISLVINTILSVKIFIFHCMGNKTVRYVFIHTKKVQTVHTYIHTDTQTDRQTQAKIKSVVYGRCLWIDMASYGFPYTLIESSFPIFNFRLVHWYCVFGQKCQRFVATNERLWWI